MPKKEQPDGIIYYMYDPVKFRIKIGTTIHLRDRYLRYMPRHGMYYVLGVERGSYKKEKALHRRFSHLRKRDHVTGVSPEQFEPAPELLEYIQVNTQRFEFEEGNLWVHPFTGIKSA